MTWGGIPQAPDFIVVGGKYGDGVILLASKQLSYVELREEFDHLNVLRKEYDPPAVHRILLTAKMRDYIMVREDSYPQAWQTLFDRWTPENDQQELPAVRELPRNV